ncbi:hypothetical protein AL539_20060 [Vibrio alginolyticus]|uniref:hypothetical protein n=1 Tax=Vibrio alginolyticus TaxID=663 RepID=UPI000CE99F61|nr:hypothetical protein [Vibrio alginolyticus]ELA9815148.1 hypothetical protein [Vibrio parahaemolyticus]HDY7922641.1 hypothetical protein [Vibrio vulnificus]AVF75857.1 hypothetical protein AL539_20060 [Vibrio alginolyticus]ELA9889932.1 hypothetical protein [Vibrio parahaemolyticus]HCH6297817.1 hypothetical protein [Vibrio parahaemolyticus]
MSSIDMIFPEMPQYEGSWQAIYFEPVVGSGERVTIAVAAFGVSGECQIIQSIRSELLECLYGINAPRIRSMIDMVLQSSRTYYRSEKTLQGWIAPFDGVFLGQLTRALDDDLTGILKQAIRFSSSLSSLALDADRDEDEDVQPKRYSAKFSKNIQTELYNINSSLDDAFNQKVKVSESDVLTAFGFMNDRYVSNFGLLVPTRMSGSLNAIKARIFDIEALKKSSYLMMPERFEVIIGTPSFSDPTLSDKSIVRLKDTLEMVEEIALKENINVFRAETALDAAKHINRMAA